jgi:hypothetical protein
MMFYGLRGMRALTGILVVVVAAAAMTASALAGRTGGLNASAAPCPDPAKAAAQGGCLVDPWPSAPNKLSQAVAKAAFTHNFTAIWSYLHPKLQKAISETAWQSCQKRNPIASPGVKIGKVSIADSKPVPIVLPLLGKQKLRAITLQVLFTAPGGGGQQIAIEYAYWIQDKGNWKAVWLPEVYSLYKSGKCDTGTTRGLY